MKHNSTEYTNAANNQNSPSAVAAANPLRFHPLLPTIAEASISPEAFDSDHVPCYYEIPTTDVTNQELLKIISYNLLMPNLCSGFTPGDETEAQSDQRAERLIAKLKLFLDTYDNDIFCLQESFFNSEQISAIAAVLCSQWQFIQGKSGKLVLVNTDRVKVLEEIAESRDGTQKIKLLFKNKALLLVNAHLQNQNLPIKTENQVFSLFDLSENVVVVGDFNSRVTPIESESKIIVTNVVSRSFRENKGQGCDWTDGCFYKFHYDQKPHQARRLLANLASNNTSTQTLEAQDNLSLETFDSGKLTEFQKLELKRHRPFMHIDDHYKSLLIDNFATVYELETLFSQHQIKVRWASNALNERSIAIILSPAFKKENIAITNFCKKQPTVTTQRIEDDTFNLTVIFVPEKSIRDFVSDYHKELLWKFSGDSLTNLPNGFSLPMLQSVNGTDVELSKLKALLEKSPESTPKGSQVNEVMITVENYLRTMLFLEEDPVAVKRFQEILDFYTANDNPAMRKIGVALCVIGTLALIIGLALLASNLFLVSAVLTTLKSLTDVTLISAGLATTAGGAGSIIAGATTMFFTRPSAVTSALEDIATKHPPKPIV